MLGRRASRLAPPRPRRGARLGIPRYCPCAPRRVPMDALLRPLAYYTLVSRCGRARCPYHAANPRTSPRTARAPLPCASVAALHHTRALLGRRDEDIAPYRHYTREIRMHYPSRIAPWYGFVIPAPRPCPIAPPRPMDALPRPSRTTRSCPVAVGRDVPIAPPTRAPRRATPVSRCRALSLPRSITPAHYSGGAMRTSRPTAITPAKFTCITQVASPRGVVSSHPFLARATAPCAPPAPHRRARRRAPSPCAPPAPHRRARRRAPSPCAPPVSRCGRARCLAAGPPGSRRRTPH